MTRIAKPATLVAFTGVLAAGCSPGLIGEPSLPGVPAPTAQPQGPKPTDPVGPAELPPFVPGALGLRRMVAREYLASVSELFGPEAAAVATPPADAAVNGLEAIGASQLALTDAAIAAYEGSARAIADVAVAQGVRTRYVSCTPTGADDASCMSTLVAALAERMFRRPLEADERERWVQVGLNASTRLEDFDGGVRWVIIGLLQSPFFLYRIELGTSDLTDATRLRLAPYEFASRLSFFLTGATPEPWLLEAAGRGELETAANVRAAAVRLLESEKAKTALAAFYDEVFKLRELATLPKDQTLYPNFGPSLRSAMREETQRLLADIIWVQNGDYRQLYSAPYTFVNAELAAHSGLPAPSGAGFQKVNIPAGTERGGFLGQASFLSLNSHSVMTSPTLRGKFVREILLCQAIPAPPPNVNTNLPPDEPGRPKRTMRERLLKHQEDEACAGCHVAMDGPGLGLENFDAIGAFRTTENGATIDAQSTIDGQSFKGAGELGALIGNNPRAAECIVRQLYRQATGQLEGRPQSRAIRDLTQAFVGSQYKLQTLLVELAASDAFRYGAVGDGS